MADRSFKSWLRNSDTITSIAVFILSFSITVWELFHIPHLYDGWLGDIEQGVFEGIFGTMAVLLMPALCVLITYKGFIQAWDDWKNGKTR